MPDVDTQMFRRPNETDRQKFDIDLNKPRTQKTAREKFENELSKQEIEASKQGLPFARQVARDEFNQAIKEQVDKQMREFGRIENPDQIKKPKVDWKRYSDLKNFELIEEGETYDSDATKVNPGLRVSNKKKVYKFKGYGFKYTVMEDGPSALRRAQESTWTAKKEFDKKS